MKGNEPAFRLTRQGQRRLKEKHPWLTADDLETPRGRGPQWPRRPCLVSAFGAWWFFSPESFLKLRRLGLASDLGWQSPPRKPDGAALLDSAQFKAVLGPWLHEHLLALFKKKMSLVHATSGGLPSHRQPTEDLCFRWVFSENDGLPGLVVDVFGDTLAVQVNSAPMEIFFPTLEATLRAVFESAALGPAAQSLRVQIVPLRDGSVREKEGLSRIVSENDVIKDLIWNGFRWRFSIGAQKTGAYFDQRDNHQRLNALIRSIARPIARPKPQVWDLCCFQGGFTLHALAAGAQVLALDQSAQALDLLRHNVDVNFSSEAQVEVVQADVFDWLSKKALAVSTDAGGPCPDLIVLDPPSLVKARSGLAGALRGFRDLNRNAMKCLAPRGYLVSCVCSHHVSEADYKKVLQEAADLAGRTFEIMGVHGPSGDHAPLESFPQGRYLQAWFLHLN
jgi:23S rRNA (cytosine1962-C5)-methyltransferase